MHTPEQIEKWAREAGMVVQFRFGDLVHGTAEQLTRFAALVAQHERERCAQVCERLTVAIDNGGHEYRREAGALRCAIEIRKGQQ